MDTPGRAYIHARRLFVIRQPLNTEITLHGNLLIVIELHGPKRTCLDAFFAPNTWELSVSMLILEISQPLSGLLISGNHQPCSATITLGSIPVLNFPRSLARPPGDSNQIQSPSWMPYLVAVSGWISTIGSGLISLSHGSFDRQF